MMIEIGSEFWSGCTPLDGNGVKELLPIGMKIHYTLCGRTALELVLRDVVQQRRIHKAYLPSYCCHTMIEPFTSKGIQVAFYDVYFTETGIDCDFSEDNDCDLVYLMDYFGFSNRITMQRAEEQKKRKKCVVYDATHAMFCENMEYSSCDYVFGSFRKWFGVNAGFCAKEGTWNRFPALGQNFRYTELRNAAFEQKQRFMEGKHERKDVFLQSFSHAEELLEMDYIGYSPDNMSVQILETVDVNFVRNKRKENAECAIEAINLSGLEYVYSPYKTIREKDCPLFVPLWVKPSVRAALRGKLIENRVYLPIHWPLSSLHRTNDVSQMIYNAELSFVCDQRYAASDMLRAAQIIRSV